MLTETEKYQLSLYETEQVISESEQARIEKVRSTFDGKFYIKRIYKEDKRELFKILQKIENPFLPKIQAIFFDEDTIIIEEYIDGVQLTDLLTEKKLTPAQTETIAKGLLSALESLHVHIVIHRDIKPENILIAADGAPKLIDFGVARIYREHETKDTSQFGTHGYAAPEQYGFGQSDFRTDIYALGITFQKMATASDISGRFKQMADKCAEFDPKNRFSSVEEIVRFWDGKQSNFSRKKNFIFAASCFFLFVVVVLMNVVSKQDMNAPLIAEETASGTSTVQNVSISPSKENDIKYLVYDRFDDRLFSYQIEETPPSLLFVGETRDKTQSATLDFGDGAGNISILAKLTDNTLHLELKDSKGKSAVYDLQNSRKFSRVPEGRPFHHDAEILFYDMDHDGIVEIFPTIAERRFAGQLMNGMNYYPTGYVSAWCISYSPEKGFLLSDIEVQEREAPVQVNNRTLSTNMGLDVFVVNENGMLEKMKY